LKENKYHLCISKKVNDTYNVVWNSTILFPCNNVFEWTEQYGVFGSSKNQTGHVVKNSTNIRNIQLGQTSTLNDLCDMSPAQGKPHPSGGHFTVSNRCVGCEMYIGTAQSINGSKKTPTFLSDNGKSSQTILFPTNSVQVFFHQSFKTGTLFKEPVKVPTEVVFTPETASQSRFFNNSFEWIVEGADQGADQQKRGPGSNKGFFLGV